ncbi:MAG: VOC family protein [Haliea sp.]|jgi:catechol 2,3-dioxygenase-like lactoylglutathione lyase family enzyme|nr:VOC family protein [Haliea sp.]
MFSHVMIGADNVEESKQFYDAILGALGHGPGVMDDQGRCFYFTDTGIFAITQPIDGQPATHGNGSTVGFATASPELADAWHAAGVANGGTTCEDPPGVREGGIGKLYLAYLRDPAGNKLCALHRMG